MQTKQCTKCKEVKEVNNFNKASIKSRLKDGIMNWCKECQHKYDKEYRKNNKEKDRLRHNIYYENNEIKIKAYQKEYNKEYYENNKEKASKTNKLWIKNNIEQHKIYMREYFKEWIKNSTHKLSHNISRLIRDSLKDNKGGKHWEELVGYTILELKQHLKSLFTKGMTWDNYGAWHIDHIIPVSLWKFETYNDREFKQCFALCNLQPLWAFDNIKKHNRI